MAGDCVGAACAFHLMAGRSFSDVDGEVGRQTAGRSDDGETHSGRASLDSVKLEKAIRGHVIGPLKNAHPVGKEAGNGRAEPSTEELFDGLTHSQIMAALLSPVPGPFNDMLDAMLERENRLKHVCSRVVGPAAEELGEMWHQDRASFAQVSVACSRLSMMIHQVAAARRPQRQGSHARSILFARMPNADHTIGLSVIAACFREAGWDVDGGADLSADDDLVRKLGMRRYSVFGLSVGRTEEISGASACFRSVRRKLANSRPLFLAGGPVIALNGLDASGLNADFVAGDAWQALAVAEESIS